MAGRGLWEVLQIRDMRASLELQGKMMNSTTCTHHKQSPDSIVDEDGSGCDEHAESHKAVELQLSGVDLPCITPRHTILKLRV